MATPKKPRTEGEYLVLVGISVPPNDLYYPPDTVVSADTLGDDLTWMLDQGIVQRHGGGGRASGLPSPSVPTSSAPTEDAGEAPTEEQE